MNISKSWQGLAGLLICVSALVYAGDDYDLNSGGCGNQQSPTEESQGGSEGDGPMKSSDPINLSTGDYQRVQTDMFRPGRGLDFELTRMYRSRSSIYADDTLSGDADPTGGPSGKEIGDDEIAKRSPLGIGWQLNYNMRIDLSHDAGIVLDGSQGLVPNPEPVITADNEPNSIYFYSAAGRWDKYEKYTTHDAVGGDPALYANSGISIQFRYSEYNGFIEMFDENQVRYRFKPFFDVENEQVVIRPYAGRLHSITDTNGNQMTFTYETSNGVERLASITDSLDHTINFLYHDNPASPIYNQHAFDHVAHLLWRVEDVTASRFVDYEFDNISADYEARLVSVTLPAIDHNANFQLQYSAGGDSVDHARFPNGRKWEYEYGQDSTSYTWMRYGLLTKVTDPNGVVILQNEYDRSASETSQRTYGRVIRQQYGDEAYNYVLIDDRNRLEFTNAGFDYYVWVNDRRGAIIRFKYAGQSGSNPDASQFQLLEKVEFLDMVSDPDLRVYGETDLSTGAITWKQIDSNGVVSNLQITAPRTDAANIVVTEFAPANVGFNIGGVAVQGGSSTQTTYQNHDYPLPGNLPNPQFNRTVTSRTVKSPDGVTPVIEITKQWRYDFDFGGIGGGCGCGSAGFFTAYKDGNGNVSRMVFDDLTDPGTGRASGNLLAVYMGLPSRFFNGDPFDEVDAAGEAASVEKYTYNEWGQVETHEHPGVWTLDGNGMELFHKRVDKYEYYTNSSDAANYGRLKKKIVDFGGFNLETTYEYDLIGNPIKVTDPDGDYSAYLYNQMSELIRSQSFSVTNTLFAEKMYFYDANGNVVVEEELNLDGNQSVVNSNKWFTTVHLYNKQDNRIESSRELDAFSTSLYSNYVPTTTNPSRAAQSEASNSDFITQRWDYNGNQYLTRFEDGEAVNGTQIGNVVTYEYDARDLLVEMIDGAGSTTPVKVKYQYDDERNLSAKTLNPDSMTDSRVVGYTYDGINRLSTITDPMGNTFSYEYDKNHNVTGAVACGPLGVDQPGPDAWDVLAKMSRTYDRLDRKTAQTIEAFDYVTGFSSDCATVPSGAEQQVTGLTYNPDSSLRKLTVPSGTGSDGETKFYYDTASRLEFKEDADGNLLQGFYDIGSNLIKLTQTDFATETLGLFELFEIQMSYDAMDRRVNRTDDVGNVTQYKFDSRSNVIEAIDAYGTVTAHTYDALNRLTKIERDKPTSISTPLISELRSYDDTHRLVSETDDNGNVTQYSYDALNRVTTLTLPNNKTYSMSYDANGNPIQYTDARGVVVNQFFDLNNRLTKREIENVTVGTSKEEFEFDGLGRLLTATNWHEEAGLDTLLTRFTREYDSRSNLVKETQNADGANSFPVSADREVEYAFDLANNNIQIGYPSGRNIYRTHDLLNRLSGVFNDATHLDSVTEFEYVGRRIAARLHGNGTRTDYTYNGVSDGNGGINNASGDHGFGRLTKISTTAVGTSTVLDQFEFTWDKNQNRTSYKDTGSDMKNRRHRTFGYDSIDRLTSTDVDFPDPLTDFQSPTNNGVTVYTLDGVHNRTDVTGFEGAGAPIGSYTQTGGQADLNQYSLTPREAGGDWVLFYDDNGNLIERVQNGPADLNGDYTHNFFDVSQFNIWYNAGDMQADYNGDGQLNYFDVNAFIGDFNPANGTDLEHWHYTYDYRNQLVSVTSSFGTATPAGTTNTYDSLARRVLEESVGQTKQMVYGGHSAWEVLEQIDLSQSPEAVLTTHVYGLGIDDEIGYRIQDLLTPEDMWSHRDDLNSLTSVTDSSGAVVERYEYGDYGTLTVYDHAGVELVSGTQFSAQHFYTGRLQITGGNLYDLRFRVLDPRTGRFNQRDPFGFVDTMNLYAYVASSPFNYTDPFGLLLEPGFGGGDNPIQEGDEHGRSPSDGVYVVPGHGYEDSEGNPKPGKFRTDSGVRVDTNGVVRGVENPKKQGRKATNPAVEDFLDDLNSQPDGTLIKLASCYAGEGEEGDELGEAISRNVPGKTIRLYTTGVTTQGDNYGKVRRYRSWGIRKYYKDFRDGERVDTGKPPNSGPGKGKGKGKGEGGGESDCGDC